MSCKNDFSNLKAGFAAVEHDASLNLNSRIEEDSISGTLVLQADILNTGVSAAHLDYAELRLDISAMDLADSRVISGAGRMGHRLNRFDIANTSCEIASEQFLLFRKGHSDYFLAGLLTWKTFHGTITFRNGILKIRFPGDFKFIGQGGSTSLEKVLLVRSQNWQDALSLYSEKLAFENNASPKHCGWHGWGTWDYYADKFGERQILENLAVMKADKMPCNLIQMDDGYSVWGGDWLSLKPEAFPDGMEGLTAKIEKSGCSAGIWLAPFITHKNSKLAAEHPEWLLQTGCGPLEMAPYPYYVLDYSLDEPCAWLAGVLSAMKHSWGIKYFKLDFLLMGVKPCRSAVDGITPLERFHRCLGTIKAALGNDVYILGCSAFFGPCCGYVDGMRTGPDIFPQYPAVKTSVFCNISSYFMHGKVFNCDPDYILLRSTDDEDKELTASPSKKGQLSTNEAQLWADFVTSFGNAAISSDKLSILSKARKDILRKVLESGHSDECIPLDFWAGDNTSIPGCLLNRKGGVCHLSLFNWSDARSGLRISGFLPGEKLFQERDSTELLPQNGILDVALQPHSSKIFIYRGERTFDRLRRELVPDMTESMIEFSSRLGQNFKPEGKAVQLDLGEAAGCSLTLDRYTGLGMLGGLCSGVAEHDSLLGIPFKFDEPDKVRVIEMRGGEAPRGISIKVGRRLKSLYILHGCYAVKGVLYSYLMKFKGHTEELKLIVGTHIGNTDARYTSPWTSEIARRAWHDPGTEACLFLLEWVSPFQDEILDEIEVTWPVQYGHVYIAGAVGYE